jgi:hypothetical protein
VRRQAGFCRTEVTPELPNPHPRPFYRQAIPTGLAAKYFRSVIYQGECD